MARPPNQRPWIDHKPHDCKVVYEPTACPIKYINKFEDNRGTQLVKQ